MFDFVGVRTGQSAFNQWAASVGSAMAFVVTVALADIGGIYG
jgi:hypothetical protein